RCDEQGGAGRQVEAARPVASRTDHVDERRSLGQLGTTSELTHALREAANLVGGFALDPQRREQCPAHCGCDGAVRKREHQLGGLRLAQILALKQKLECFFDQCHGDLVPSRSFRKSPMSCGPCGVSTLSGWNCTPSIA